MTLYLLKENVQTFLSIPVTQKCQILSCDTLVANERCQDAVSVIVFDYVSYVKNTYIVICVHMRRRGTMINGLGRAQK